MKREKRLQSAVDTKEGEAKASQQREAWFKEAMQEAGLRNTAPRECLRHLFAQADTPLSIQEILDRCGGSINVVTIYRTVGEMARLGLLERLEFGEGFFRYEAASPPTDTDHRHHIVCEMCGSVSDFSGCAVEQTVQAVSQRTGFQVERHTLTFYGTCAACRRRDASPTAVSTRQ